MRRQKRNLLLWVAATDSTFEIRRSEGRRSLVGKCIHCGTRHTLSLTGEPRSDLSLEHIVPQTHRGTSALENLAIACTRCNVTKGARHDHREWSDPKLQQVITTLKKRRAERLRDPLAGLELSPLPTAL